MLILTSSTLTIYQRDLIVLYQIKCSWTDMMWEEGIQSMIYISVGMNHYHTLNSAIIITRHIKMDYTRRLASLHSLMLSDSNWWLFHAVTEEKDFFLSTESAFFTKWTYIGFIIQAQKVNFLLTADMTLTKIHTSDIWYVLKLLSAEHLWTIAEFN